MQPVSFAAIGECMIELSARDEDLWRLSYAGDTFNAAYYARLTLPAERQVAYVTALGDDPFSDRMRVFIRESSVRTDRIRTIPGRRPGLYAISLDRAERTFSYWRNDSAARLLADDEAWLDNAVADAEMLYFSGVTLGILEPAARARLLAALARSRSGGARIAFDTNFRPALWPDQASARKSMQAAHEVSDIVLPSLDDEMVLFGDPHAEAVVERVSRFGVREIVVKSGSGPCLVWAGDRAATVPSVTPEQVVDTTGAGDSFAGAYLAGRIMGQEPVEAARLGHRTAAQVIGVKGALAPIPGMYSGWP